MELNREQLRRAIGRGDIKEVKHILKEYSFLELMSIIQEKNTISKLTHVKDSKFTQQFLNYINEVNDRETMRFPDSIPYERNISKTLTPDAPKRVSHVIQDFLEHKTILINLFKKTLFKQFVQDIKKDSTDVFPLLLLCWPQHENVDVLVKKCAKESFTHMTDFIMRDIVKGKSSTYFPYINKLNFIRSLVYHCDVDFLEQFHQKYPKEIQQTFQEIALNNNYWLFKYPKDINHYYGNITIKVQNDYQYNINYDFQKVIWFEKNNLGFQALEFKNFTPILLNMSKPELQEFINFHPERIIPIIENIIDTTQGLEQVTNHYDNKPNFNPISIDFKEVLDYYKIVKLHDSLQDNLPEKSKKTLKKI